MPGQTFTAPDRKSLILAAAAFAALLAGCTDSASGKRDSGPPQAGFRVMQPVNVPIESELAGRVAASRSAEVRPQVTGVIQRQLFAEGSYVRAGQPLYQIDASLYRAAAAQAAANLQSARASASASATREARYAPLARAQAVSQQDYTDVAATARVARASVAQNQAALETARINLRYTTVPAPIGGRVGRSSFTVGALVTSAQPDPLATIAVLDPIYVDIQQSAADLVKLRRQLGSGAAAPMTAPVRLTLDDGKEYGLLGRVAFSEITVDPATGTVTMRAQFPNPQGLLLPGMFVRARFAQTSVANAYLVPQEAVTRDPTGAAQVFVVGPGNKAERRTVAATMTRGANWVVTDGLRPGDKVITQGLGKVKAGQPVRPVPETAPQVPGSRPAGGPSPAGSRS